MCSLLCCVPYSVSTLPPTVTLYVFKYTSSPSSPTFYILSYCLGILHIICHLPTIPVPSPTNLNFFYSSFSRTYIPHTVTTLYSSTLDYIYLPFLVHRDPLPLLSCSLLYLNTYANVSPLLPPGLHQALAGPVHEASLHYRFVDHHVGARKLPGDDGVRYRFFLSCFILVFGGIAGFSFGSEFGFFVPQSERDAKAFWERGMRF